MSLSLYFIYFYNIIIQSLKIEYKKYTNLIILFSIYIIYIYIYIYIYMFLVHLKDIFCHVRYISRTFGTFEDRPHNIFSIWYILRAVLKVTYFMIGNIRRHKICGMNVPIMDQIHMNIVLYLVHFRDTREFHLLAMFSCILVLYSFFLAGRTKK